MPPCALFLKGQSRRTQSGIEGTKAIEASLRQLPDTLILGQVSPERYSVELRTHPENVKP